MRIDYREEGRGKYTIVGLRAEWRLVASTSAAAEATSNPTRGPTVQGIHAMGATNRGASDPLPHCALTVV